MVMEHRTIDIAAELVVAGCVVASPRGALLAYERITADAFTRPYLRDLFDVALELPTERPTFDDPHELNLDEQRIAAAAALTDIAVDDIRKVVAARPVMDDTAGGYTNRLRRAWLRRCAVEKLGDAARLIDDEDDLDAAIALLDAAADAIRDAA